MWWNLRWYAPILGNEAKNCEGGETSPWMHNSLAHLGHGKKSQWVVPRLTWWMMAGRCQKCFVCQFWGWEDRWVKEKWSVSMRYLFCCDWGSLGISVRACKLHCRSLKAPTFSTNSPLADSLFLHENQHCGQKPNVCFWNSHWYRLLAEHWVVHSFCQ